MTDYIREGVGLATGWSIDSYENDDPDYDYLSNAGGVEWHFNEDPMWVHDIPEMFIDALAAQLTRQVDALDGFWVDSDMHGVGKIWQGFLYDRKGRVGKSNNKDRTMNTIICIVDSGVLK